MHRLLCAMYRRIDAWHLPELRFSVDGVVGRWKLIEEVEGTSVGSFGFVITVTDVRAKLKEALAYLRRVFFLRYWAM